MMNIREILVPVDFSGASAAATRQAAALARHFHAELAMLRVQSPLRYVAGGLEGVYMGPIPEELAEQERKQLDGFLASELDDLSVRRVMAEGDAAQRIVEFAQAEKVGLIVMPTHGYGPFRRFILGSVTAKVLHDAQCPVWTGTHLSEAPVTDGLTIASVLCAVDLSPHSRQTLGWAAQVAAEFGAHLTVLHAVPPLELAGPGARYYNPEWAEAMRAQALDGIAKLQQELGTKADAAVESGDAPYVARLAAERAHTDLLVIGRSPSGGRLRTNAYAIIRESPCPVLSV
jgi:nucleotide-binding universal stress UspA family protein